MGKSKVGTVEKNKFKLELSHKIALGSLSVAIIVALFGNNLISKWREGEKTSNTMKPSVPTTNDTLRKTIDLPYLEKVPILEKSLFIEYYYNNFVIGGINIDLVTLNARTFEGDKIAIKKEDGLIIMDIYKQPYLEIGFKGSFYSIETTGIGRSFKSVIRKIAKPTLVLKSYEASN